MRATIANALLPVGTNSIAYATNNVWQQAPLDTIFSSQIKADGTPASFATLANNQFTLAIGVYRIDAINTMNSISTTFVKFASRLYNVTVAAPAWVGKSNEISQVLQNTSLNQTMSMSLSGTLILTKPTTFELQGLCNNNSGISFGISHWNTGFTIPNEFYRWIEITKTA